MSSFHILVRLWARVSTSGNASVSFQEDRAGLMRELVHAPIKHNVLIEDATHFVLFEDKRFVFFEEILKFLKE